jgi:hypothetical protein
MAAIGASSVGSRATARPGSARRKLLTQATSGNSRMTRWNDRMMPMTGIGHEGVEDLMLQHERDQRAQNEEHQHPHQKDAGRAELDFEETVACHRL